MSFVKIFDNQGGIKREQVLEKLLQKVEQYYSEEAKESLVIEIADLILRSRPLCRHYKGQPLTGVYQEIYHQVHCLLVDWITQKLQTSDFNSITYEWLNQIQLQTFRIVLDDSRLKELALNAQNQIPNSSLRSYALTELVKAIKLSNQLCYPHRNLFSSKFYPLIYEEAVVQTMTYICTNIDRYDPQRGKGKFMSWVNFKLDKAVLICRRQFDLSYKYESCYLPDFDIIPDHPKTLTLGELLYQYLEKDPKGIFQKTFIIGNPQANFRAIALKRLSGKTWKEIARELKSKVSVLSAFYRRNCQKFQTLLQRELEG
ncbi:Sigma-70 region 4 type 2 [Hyella patelloides LEGE 07179]|uniref:Sigma-70 region 4 type 2 n=1 Tax=Hyella patelloides LEGE 07179 TaxID=945734 RepID=A0A563VW73_9CYAN|nr:hypothetical protein [Hyella patelloides]VEP15708.1 Sigma-70 region 4 type 2 [Hyella patelloides LEGE 07179]